MSDTDGIPDWWIENLRIKREMGLPSYVPPRFKDGAYTYEIVKPIEDRCDCRIQFLGIDTRYKEDWEVRVNDCMAFEIGRHRDDNGNTVYGITGNEFKQRINKYLVDCNLTDVDES